MLMNDTSLQTCLIRSVSENKLIQPLLNEFTSLLCKLYHFLVSLSNLSDKSELYFSSLKT
jgi:hypothetical protein